MNKDTVKFAVSLITIVAIFAGVIGGVLIYSGMSSPLTVIESKSMQHSSDTSYLGIIDTGDMVVMVDPNKTNIVTYVEGYQSGYSKFGSYGDVIIYHRSVENSGNPIIHRAMLWLDYIGDGKWSAPSLEHYDTARWSVTEGTWNSMSGILTLKDLQGPNNTRISCSVNLNALSLYPHSGYLTKGDNNNAFDQPANISGVEGLVKKSQVKAVAGIEIPWLGCIKLLMKNKNVNMIPSNSIPCLVILLIDIIMLFVVIFTILRYYDDKRRAEEEYQIMLQKQAERKAKKHKRK